MPKNNENNNVEESIIEENIEVKSIEQKEELCKILWIRERSFALAFPFEGIEYGIHFNVEHLLDAEKIQNPIRVKYEGTFGTPYFKIYPVFE